MEIAAHGNANCLMHRYWNQGGDPVSSQKIAE
jgi:hypothetical protein